MSQNRCVAVAFKYLIRDKVPTHHTCTNSICLQTWFFCKANFRTVCHIYTQYDSSHSLIRAARTGCPSTSSSGSHSAACARLNTRFYAYIGDMSNMSLLVLLQNDRLAWPSNTTSSSRLGANAVILVVLNNLMHFCHMAVVAFSSTVYLHNGWVNPWSYI